MMRVSKGTSSSLPSGRIMRVESARSRACWTLGAALPISSSIRVPPSAVRKAPLRGWRASVKAPLTWPNRVSMSRFSSRAPQLMVMKGPLARGLAWWMAAETSSLPVPVSPMTRTSAMVGAALRMLARRSCMAAEVPTRPFSGMSSSSGMFSAGSRAQRASCMSCWLSCSSSLRRRRWSRALMASLSCSSSRGMGGSTSGLELWLSMRMFTSLDRRRRRLVVPRASQARPRPSRQMPASRQML